MFRNREAAGFRLAEVLKERPWHHLVVLGIPRGGVVIGAILAAALDGELDVMLARKLRAPFNPELAIGAVAEDGQMILAPHAASIPGVTGEYIERERACQVAEIDRRKRLFREIRPPASVRGRSVIITDDGIATGATMLAAVQATRAREPRELVVAVPVARTDRIEELKQHCDEVVCLVAPTELSAVGCFYADFTQVDDQQVMELLREFAPL